MTLNSLSIPLRYVLWADCLSSLACALPQALIAGSLARELGLSEMLLLHTGYFLFLSGVLVGFLAISARPPRGLIWGLILGNCFWGVACIAVIVDGNTITALGKAYVLSQAIVVVVLAVLQYAGLRHNKADLAAR